MTSLKQSDATIRKFIGKLFSNTDDFEFSIEKRHDTDILECLLRIARSDNPDVNTGVLDPTTGRQMLSGRTPYMPLEGMVPDIFSREEIAVMFATEIASKEIEKRLTRIVSEDIERTLKYANIDYKISTIFAKDFNMFSKYVEFIVFFIGKESDFKKMTVHLTKFEIWGDPIGCDRYGRHYKEELNERLCELFPGLGEHDED